MPLLDELQGLHLSSDHVIMVNPADFATLEALLDPRLPGTLFNRRRTLFGAQVMATTTQPAGSISVFTPPQGPTRIWPIVDVPRVVGARTASGTVAALLPSEAPPPEPGDRTLWDRLDEAEDE